MAAGCQLLHVYLGAAARQMGYSCEAAPQISTALKDELFVTIAHGDELFPNSTEGRES